MNAPNDQLTPAPEAINATEEEALIALAGHAIAIASQHNRRVIFGIAGGPGSGKSTMAAKLIGILDQAVPGAAARVPMDGFHLPHADLVARGWEAEKGAPHTFDGAGFVRFLHQIKAAREPVSVPSYSRRTEDIVPDAFTIAGNVPILVVEGNYLLLSSPPWHRVRPLLDYAVYLNVPREKVKARLLKRHAEHGLFTPDRIRGHVDNVDMANFDHVARSRAQADLIVHLETAK